ncbi:hypothetical protein K461DRAFT_138171 [Myriangium duriaei CBS 260.36]|uniref:Apple domain-containing protein n=1 Tax=Myriangium duriaei CBS 260.36 TaxID=1168546 RepID=A0A9P4J6F4_9PEZI|nr:hypothetical protein K461DRAFT_138171 [Myriangium duriaei CBS 260.36]
MSSPTTQHSIIDSPVSSHHSPQRLSNLYQYHNAPEVAPAAGLEYDDSIHPWSDKYPVVQSSPYQRWSPGSTATKEAEIINHKPPLIIFGMKLRTFLVVTVVVICIIIGASVGGALGRPKQATAVTSQGSSTTLTAMASSASSTSATAQSSGATSTYAAPVPTYSVLNDCPQSNNTVYTASAASSSSERSLFTKYCNMASPLANQGSKTLSQAFVYSFDDCVDVCAGMNYWGGNTTCNVAAFVYGAARPANCYVGFANISSDPGALGVQQGLNIALLTS